MISAKQVQKVIALNYTIEPDDQAALTRLINRQFANFEIDKLLTEFESLLAPWSTPPELKEIRFFEQPPWLRIQYYSANYLDENDGLVLARIFRYDNDQLIVEHEYFVLPENARGKMVGKKLLAASFEQYERMGVKEIRVFAGLSDGGLVWAKVGFKATSRSEMDMILKIAQLSLSTEQFEDVQAIYDLYYTIEPDGTAFPIKDWALLGFMDNILKQVDWHGRIDLTNDKELSNFKKYVNREK